MSLLLLQLVLFLLLALLQHYRALAVNVCVAVAVFPLVSVTVHVTVVFPNGNEFGALFVTEATAQLSEVTGVPKVTLFALHPLLVVMDTVAGAVIDGTVVSLSVTVVAAETAEHPEALVTVT